MASRLEWRDENTSPTLKVVSSITKTEGGKCNILVWSKDPTCWAQQMFKWYRYEKSWVQPLYPVMPLKINLCKWLQLCVRCRCRHKGRLRCWAYSCTTESKSFFHCRSDISDHNCWAMSWGQRKPVCHQVAVTFSIQKPSGLRTEPHNLAPIQKGYFSSGWLDLPKKKKKHKSVAWFL